MENFCWGNLLKSCHSVKFDGGRRSNVCLWRFETACWLQVVVRDSTVTVKGV